MVTWQKWLGTILMAATLNACASHTETLYQELGGASAIDAIVEHFINEIEHDETVLPYFRGSDIARFRKGFSLHLCSVTGGPCDYDGDTMVRVHGGMSITESDFNRTVDLLIRAMDNADIPHRLQNQILAKLTPFRKDIIYQ
tara:strand:- start:189 stop:614 length:426 start_codon:yes stop_codon:yes gene_type:complete